MGILDSLPSSVPKYAAEFIGTYILVLTIGCNALGSGSIWAITSIASALTVGVYSLGPVSGAHFNPSVTLAILLCNKLPGGISEAGIYITLQIAGALCGSLSYLLLFGGESFDLGPGSGHHWLAAALVELIYTCMLCLVVLNVACSSSSKDNQYYGIAIGFVIIAGGYAVGTISGAAFNPSVSIALDVSSPHRGFGMCVVYTAFQLAGAALSASLFRLIRSEDYGGAKNSLSARLLSEFIGTYFLTCTVGFNVLKASAAAPWSIAACLMSMIYALGNCSGGHFNPAVTLAVYLSGRGKIDSSDTFRYIVTQCASSVLAGLTYSGLLGLSMPLNPGLSWGKTAITEIIYTALLCFTVLSVATVIKPSKDMFGLAIASVITTAGFAGAKAGVCLNPAVGLGIDFANFVKGGNFGHSFYYGGMEVIGSVLAVGLFQAIRPGEYGGGNKVDV